MMISNLYLVSCIIDPAHSLCALYSDQCITVTLHLPMPSGWKVMGEIVLYISGCKCGNAYFSIPISS